jgi:UDP-N-acetyl-D-mannosaminuronic acid transferase (WecB/TagA/CpsF family)
MVDAGFEWLYRIFFWPQKIKRIKRLWNAIFVFMYTIYISK